MGPRISEKAKIFMAENKTEIDNLKKSILNKNDSDFDEKDYNAKNLDFTNRAVEFCGKECGNFILCYVKDGKNVTVYPE